MKATDLRKLAEAATPGPWKHYYARALRGGFDGNPVNEVQSDEHCPIVNWGGFDDSDRTNKGHKANAAFIAAANPTAVLALLDEIETLRAKVEAQSKALKPFLFDDMRFDPVTKWDDETKIIVSFPRKKKAIPTSWFYIEHIKNARRAAQLGKTNEH